MADINHDILLFQNPEDEDNSLHDLLLKLNTDPKIANDFDSLPKTLENLSHPILVAFCGSTEESALAAAKKLIQQPEIHCYPLIVLGYRVHELTSVLSSYFPISITVPLPYNSSHLFRALTHVKNAYRRLVQVHDAHDKRQAREASADTRPEEVKQDSARADVTLTLAVELESLPSSLFEEIKRLKLGQQQLEGKLYTSDIPLDFIEKRGYLPTDSKVLGAVKNYFRNTHHWVMGHLCRCCFISNKMIESTGTTGEAAENLKGAVMLSALSFSADDLALLKLNYDEEKYAAARKDLCSRIKDSAYKAAVEVGNAAIGDMISRYAQVIGGEKAVLTPEQKLTTSIIVAANLIDRVCYATGYWNPRAAYQLMRRFKGGYMRDMHPSIWGCAIKFLSEAISAKTAICVLPKEMRKNQSLIEEAIRLRDSEKPEQHEVQVPIADLQPGMKLSRPLISFDGKKILSDQIVLDQDLVWRIWQLSAVRPLNPPIIFQASKEEEKEVDVV